MIFLSLIAKIAVSGESLLHLRATVDNSAMITASNELPDTRSWHLSVFLSEVHRHLTSHYMLALTATAAHSGGRDIEVVAYRLDDFINSKRTVVHLNGTLDNTLCQCHVNVAVIHDTICHQRIHHSFEVAYTAVGCLRDETHHIFRDVQSVMLYLAVEYVNAKLLVRFLQFGCKSTCETS